MGGGMGGRSVVVRRRRALAILIVVGVLAGGVGWFASGWVKSPAQVVAERTAPPRSSLTARVEHRVLGRTIVTRGTVKASQQVTVNGAAVGEGKPIVTRMRVNVGATVKAGSVLVEVSGRPIIALPGSLPVYRDLRPTSKGRDVRQLQRALASLGHQTSPDPPGVFGGGTKRAVAALYRDIGYDPLPATGGGAVEAAKDDVRTLGRAEQEAERAYDRVVADREAAQKAGAPYDNRQVEDAARTLRYAREDLDRSEERLRREEARAGPRLPASEVVFVAKVPAWVDQVAVKVGSTAAGKLLTLSAGGLQVTGSLEAHDRSGVRAGSRVELASEVHGETAKGRVAGIGPAPAGGDELGENPGGFRFTVVPDRPLNPKWVGQNVRLTVRAASTEHKVLVVPISAVAASADGRTTVTVLAGKRHRKVPVRPGLSGNGYVEVTPVSGAGLHQGDQVVVGVKRGGVG